jgi:hypothetical protein
MLMGYIVNLWPAPPYNIFQHYLINGTIFERKKKVTEHEMCVVILSTTFVRNISHSKNWERDEKKMYIGVQAKYPLFYPDFNET